MTLELRRDTRVKIESHCNTNSKEYKVLEMIAQVLQVVPQGRGRKKFTLESTIEIIPENRTDAHTRVEIHPKWGEGWNIAAASVYLHGFPYLGEVVHQNDTLVIKYNAHNEVMFDADVITVHYHAKYKD
ncbi:MAG: hypothetical protein Q7R56_00115 [Nanoarchaeota archaeon]|nr:hypothetical protein [Nanoarchaeota archaeon]